MFAPLAVHLAAPSGEAAKSGPMGLLVILVLVVVCYFLFRSMTKHLRKVRDDFPTDEPKPKPPPGPRPNGSGSGPESGSDSGSSSSSGNGSSGGSSSGSSSAPRGREPSAP